MTTCIDCQGFGLKFDPILDGSVECPCVPDTERAPWMQTASGQQFYPLEPVLETITIEDIAHALSNICRFGGHTRWHYSVAQHSYLVSHVCDPQDALWGLLHDASEAYIGDVIQPLKSSPAWRDYAEVEHRLQSAICRKFGLPPIMPDSVKRADLIVLATEKRDVMEKAPADWGTLPEPMPEWIGRMWPDWVRETFLSRFKELTK